MKLKVGLGFQRDRYEDIARIHRKYRKTRHGDSIPSGKVFHVYCVETGREAFLIARGLASSKERQIRIDYQVRQKLGVKSGQHYHFELKKADFCGEVWWALHATDTQYSFAARLSLFSLVLGMVSFALGLGLWIAIISSHP